MFDIVEIQLGGTKVIEVDKLMREYFFDLFRIFAFVLANHNLIVFLVITAQQGFSARNTSNMSRWNHRTT